jgi:iron complex outermembrane recepter protein
MSFNKNEVVKDDAGNPIIHASEILLKSPTALTTYFNREDQSRLEVANPRSKINFQVNFKRGKFAAMLRNVYFGSVTYLNPNAGEVNPANWVVNTATGQKETRDQIFGGRVITDISASYQFNPQINFTLGANNLLDVYPDKQVHSENISYGRFLYSRRVQQFGFNGAYFFGRVSFNLR